MFHQDLIIYIYIYTLAYISFHLEQQINLISQMMVFEKDEGFVKFAAILGKL